MKASNAAIDIIKRFEGCRYNPYRDAGGLWTVGYGHLIGDGKSLPSILDKRFTQAEVDGLLLQDIARIERGVDMCITVPVTQNQFDACVCWAFNLGVESFKKYVAPCINGGDDPKEVVAEMVKFHFVGHTSLDGLVERREAEKELFLKD